MQNILINLTEDWKKNFDNNFVVEVVLTGLSKNFNCIPHDLLLRNYQLAILVMRLCLIFIRTRQIADSVSVKQHIESGRD